MSKPKTSKKQLIIEDDEPKEDGERLNPFSFREFIRGKNSGPVNPVEKTSGCACSVEDEYKYARDFEHGQKVHFFTDSSLLDQSFDYKPEDEWTENYHPSVIGELHDLRLSGTLEGSAYLDPSLLSFEDKDDMVNEWQLEEDFSPQPHLHRRSTDSYEGDEEISVIDVTLPSKKSCIKNGISYQQKLREENSQLRKQIRELMVKSEADSLKIRQFADELYQRKVQEEREAKALESMVQSVEENLKLMTKRAVKAESSLSKLKQDVQQLQSQLDACRCENERLRAEESAAINSMRQNAHAASKYLTKAAQDAESSIKQLLTGRETLCFVSELLSSIDKISEIPK